MNNITPPCPECRSIYAYQEQGRWSCPECGHEWDCQSTASENEADDATDRLEIAAAVRDANGEILNDGDTVILTKDLKIKGSNQTIKIGTKVKNIRLVDGDHDIDCKIAVFGAMKLKSQFVKKI